MPFKREIVDCMLWASLMSPEEGWRLILPVLQNPNVPNPTPEQRDADPALFATIVLEGLCCPFEGTVAAAQALRRNPDNRVARDTLDRVRCQAFSLAMNMARKFHEETVRLVLECLISALNGLVVTDEEEGILALYAMMDEARQGTLSPGGVSGRPHIIDLPIFGEWWVNKATSHSLPCLLAPGNIPDLARYGTVILNIHCREQDLAYFRALPIVQALQAHCRVVLCPMKGSIDRLTQPLALTSVADMGRVLISTFSYVSLMIARDIGADFSMAWADMLCSENFYGECKALLVSGDNIVCCTGERTDESKMAELIAAAGFPVQGALLLSAEWLYEATLKAPHPNLINSFVRVCANRLPVDPTFYYVRTPGGFTGHTFQFSLAAVAGRAIPADLRCNFMTADVRMLADLLRDPALAGAYRILDRPPATRYFCGVDTPLGASRFATSAEVTPENAALYALATAVRPSDCEFFAWSIQHAIHFTLPEGAAESFPPDEGLADDEVVERSLATIEAQTAATVSGLAALAKMKSAVHDRFNKLLPIVATASA